MFAIFSSALMAFLGAALRTLVVKFIVFTALFVVVSAFTGYLASYLPTATGLDEALGGFDDDMWFYLDTFAVTEGINIVISAYVLRFMIRRIPVIG